MDLDNRFQKLTALPLVEIPLRFSFSTSRYVFSFYKAVMAKAEANTACDDVIVAAHSHLFYEISYDGIGGGILTVDNRCIEIPARSFYLTSPGTVHSYVSTKTPDSANGFRLVFSIEKADHTSHPTVDSPELDELLDVLRSKKYLVNRDTHDAYGVISGVFEQFSRDGNRLNRVAFSLDIMRVLLLTAKAIRPLSLSSVRHNEMQTEEERLAFLDSVFKNYHTAMSPEAVAQEMNLSVRQLNRIVIKHYGISFRQQYLNSRMTLATTLLESAPTLTVAEIAEKLNFSSMSSFSHHFRANFGVSPSQYRRNNTGK